MANSSSNFQRLSTSVSSFCQLVDAIEARDGLRWLSELSLSLAELHVAMMRFAPLEVDHQLSINADLEARFDLFCQLKIFFDKYDGYSSDQDVIDLGAKRGSLADDLTDIYFELKSGLKLLELEGAEEEVLNGWQSGFVLHWGQHLVDLQRELYQLSVREFYVTVPAVRAR